MRFSGDLYRIAYAARADRVLDGVIHPEGRFHHDRQRAFYASPSPEAAAVAVATYLGPDDPARVLVPLRLVGAELADLRIPETCAALNIEPQLPSVPWADERAAGKKATSWRASDAVRRSGASGMIYSSRKVPTRWHVVLFRWNAPGAGQLTVTGPPAPWSPPDGP